MKSDFSFILTFCTALGAALNAGVFFAFSSFVMPALADLPAAQGIAAMQSINIFAVTPVFGTALLGTGVACIVLALMAWRAWQNPAAVWLLTGSLLYLVGSIGVTFVFNVPLNDVLAVVNPTAAESARVWSDYLAGWNPWNHARGVAALGATASFIVAMLRSRETASA